MHKQVIMETYVMGNQLPEMHNKEINELLKEVMPGYKLEGSTAWFAYHSGTLYLYDRQDAEIERFYKQNRSLILQQMEAVAALILNIDRLQNILSARLLSQLIHAAKDKDGKKILMVLRQLEPFYSSSPKSKYKFQRLMERVKILDAEDDEDSEGDSWDEAEFKQMAYHPVF